jgi:probable HAF family extracellular repeat protein
MQTSTPICTITGKSCSTLLRIIFRTSCVLLSTLGGLIPLASYFAPAASAQTVTPTFQILVNPAAFGTNTQALGVSADGKVVIGEYFLSDQDPSTCIVFGGCTRTFRWTAATGAQDIGLLLDKTEALGRALSADGSQMVGEAAAQTAYRRAFIWTPTIGVQDLGTPLFPNDPDHSRSEAYGMSATGSVIGGRAIRTQNSLLPQAFQFSTAPSFTFLPFLPNGIQSEVDGVSADGTVQVGVSIDNTFNGHAVRWHAGTPQDLGIAENSSFAASSDGSVVVGTMPAANCCFHAFRWTAATGMQDLGSFGGNSFSYGNAVSADGSVVVGSATPSGGGVTRAFRWTARKGFEDLNTVVANLGLNTNGYQLVFANAISADGTVIVGMAENAALSVDAAFRAVIPAPTCAPVTCASLGKNCGTISNGCGGTLTCGACSGSLTCGGGGIANVCGPLTPTTSCAALAKNCGAIPDGAGSWLACGTCSSPQICGGTGTPNVCGTPPPVPQSLTFNPNAVDGGSNTTGTVTLTQPAPAGGAVVSLNSSNSPVATVPASVTVPAGATSANFIVTTVQPAQDTVSMIAACYGGKCFTSTLYITAPTAITVAGLTINPASVTGGTASQGTVTLSGAPPGGATVTLSSGAVVAAVPASVNVPAGSTTATFPITTSAVTTTQSATISASYGGTTLSATLSVTPQGSGSVSLASLSLNPTSVKGGDSSQGTVTLSGAPSANTSVSLSSGNTSVATVPGSVIVKAGSTSATFTITTQKVSNSTNVTITATQGSVAKSAVLTVTGRR